MASNEAIIFILKRGDVMKKLNSVFSMLVCSISVLIVVIVSLLAVDIAYGSANNNVFAVSIDNASSVDVDDYEVIDVYDILKGSNKVQDGQDEVCYQYQVDDKQLHDDMRAFFSQIVNRIFNMHANYSAVKIANETPLDYDASLSIVDYANKFDLDISLLLGLIDLESSFEQYEVGYSQDRGYMQIIPSTEKWLFEEYGDLLGFEYDPSRIFDPEYNIGVGSVYLYHLKQIYGDDKDRILSEYNRGPYNLKKYYAKHLTYVTKYSKTVKARSKKYRAYDNN